MRVGIVVLAACLPVLGQTPAPLGEAKSAATAMESETFAVVRGIAYAWREGLEWRAATSAMRRHGDVLRHYEIVAARIVDGGIEMRSLSHGGLNNVFRRPPDMLYFVPQSVGVTARRIFCVRRDGIVAWTDNALGRQWEGEQPFDCASVLGAGGKLDLRAFPRTPTRGRDGNLWMPASMLRTKTMRVVVVGDDREPMSMQELVCARAEERFVVDQPLVAAGFCTTIEGDARVTGLLATGLGFALRSPMVWLDPSAVDVRGNTVRITVPRDALLRARMEANEAAAVATLKNIASAQAQCQASGVIDTDNDGMGEYGTFAELSGRKAVRRGGRPIAPPVLSAAFGNVRDGIVERSGYRFRMFLPNADNVAVGEAKDGGAADEVAADPCEVRWCCYAWPVEAGRTGNRTFFITQAGDVLATAKSYSGSDNAPPAPAGFVSDKGMAEPAAADKQGADGSRWRVVR